LRAEAASAWTNLALALDGAARYPEALEALRRASVLHQAAGERASVLKLSRNAGAIHLRRLNDHAAARQRFREAMGIARELSDRAQEAALLLDLARCDLAAGEYSGARQNAERARELYRELGDPAGQAAAFIEQAHADWYRGDYPDAWVAQGRALELAERSTDRRLAVMARSLGGLIALNLGDLAEAEQRLSLALMEARSARLADEEATQLNNLGAVAREAGATETARQRFEEALRLDEERKNELGRAYDLRNLGQLELSAGRPDVALGFLAEAERLSRAVGDRFNLAKVLLGLADAERDAGRDSAAKAHAEEAERLSAELGLREIAWRAQRVLGDLRARAGELESALAHYQAALQRMESLRAVSGGDLQALSSSDKYELYDAAVQTLLRLGREDSALEMAERARSRRLLDLLSGRAIRAGGRAAELLAVIGEADRVASGLAECRDGNPEDCRAAMHQRRSAALDELRRLQPELAERIEALPLSVEELSRRLPDDTGLLYLHQGRERFWVWLLKKDRRALRTVEISRAELARRVGGLRDGIERFENIDAELEWLYQVLIAPVFSEMKGLRRLGIVPHGIWARVPFAALRASDGSYLGERFDLFWLHSAGIAEQLLRRLADRMGPAGSPVVVGNPEVPGLPPLPLSDLEAREVAHELAGAEVLLGPDATRARVMERLADADVVHLACHGVHESRQPLRSRLQLSSSRAGEGTLDAQEVFDLSLSARLVTLSAGETARWGGVAGDEVAGFPRAFLAAGAENVIASLWRVAEPATAMLMKRLYRELARHPPARALRLAQEVVRRYFPHPGYWAGFVLFGLGR
jgi:CHAT domain-containing protein